MSHDKIGPKEAMLRRQREERFATKNSKRPSASDLRNQVSKIKPMTKKGGRRGR
mgnify:CR=1 FL=1